MVWNKDYQEHREAKLKSIQEMNRKYMEGGKPIIVRKGKQVGFGEL